MSLNTESTVKGSAGARVAAPERSTGAKLARWVVGWVLLPLGCLFLIYLFGVHWGAQHPDSWILSGLRWLFAPSAP